ncbi:MAG: two-component regulator propeller domain-containing protein [Flavobacteriales bacterium]
MRRKIPLLAACLLFPLASLCQPLVAPDVVKVPVNGLGATTIHSILKDDEGFLWLGTDKGLCRFDGLNVDIHRNAPGDNLSLPYNVVTALMEDRAHRTWVGTALGACVLDKRTMRFSRKALVCAEGRLDAYPCLSLLVDKEGGIWTCAHDHGFARYDPASDVFREVAAVRKVSRIKGRSTYFTSAVRDADGVFWITHNISVIRYDPSTDQARLFVFRPGGHETPLSMLFLAVQEDATDPNTLWIRSWGAGLVRFDKRTGAFANTLVTLKGPSNVTNIVWSCAPLSPGRLLVGIDHELRPFDIRTSTFGPPVVENAIDPVPLGHPAHVVYDDPQGERWVGTDRGLFAVPHVSKVYEKWITPIIPITDDLDGGYWGVQQFTHRRLFHYDGTGRATDSIPLPNADQELYEGLAVWQLRSGKVWITTSRGLLVFDPLDRSIGWKRMTGLQKEGEHGPSLGLAVEQPDGKVWMTALHLGVIVYTPATDDFSVVPAPAGSPPDRRAASGLLGIMDKDHLWLLFDEGVGVLDTRTGHVAEVMTVGRPGPGAQGFKGVAVHANGELHAVSGNNGVYVLKYEQDSLRVTGHYQDEPNSDNYVDAAADAHGDTWIATSSGLVRFDPRKASFQRIGVADGFPMGSAFQMFADRAHRMLAKGTDLVRFDPVNVAHGTPASGLYIRSIHVNGEPVATDDAVALRLDHDHNAVTIEYAPIALINADRLHYAVWLEGNDMGWVDNGALRTVNYLALRPGEYTFHVRFADDEGIGTSARSTFVIVPAWWQTWWFRSGAALVVIFFVFLLSRYVLALRFRQRIAAFEREREMTTMRTRIARDIHDDIGSGLTRITMLSRELNGPTEEAQDKGRLASSIASASAELIGQLSEIVWTVDPVNDHAERFVAFVRDLLGRQFEELSIVLRTDLSVGAGMELRDIPPDVKRNVVLILKEAVNNALKHAGAQHINVRMRIDARALQLDVHDDGRGFDPALLNGRGNGLNNLRKRAESVGATLEMRSNGDGTHVVLVVALPTPTIMRST